MKTIKFAGRISQSERAWSGGEIRLFSGISQDGKWYASEDESRSVLVRNADWRELAFCVKVSVPQDRHIPQDRDGYPVTRRDVAASVELDPVELVRAISETLGTMKKRADEGKAFRFGDPRQGYGSYAKVNPSKGSYEHDLKEMILKTEEALRVAEGYLSVTA